MAQITTIDALEALYDDAVPAALLSLMVTPLILDTPNMPNMPNQECGDRSEMSTPLIPRSPIMMSN